VAETFRPPGRFFYDTGDSMDQDGYRQTVLRHKDRVFSYAAYLLCNREEAQDVAQEALVRLWEHRQKVPAEGGAAKAWLLRTAHNLCMDRHRIRCSRPESPPEILETHEALDAASHPAKQAEGQELRKGIEAALARLSPRDRAVVVMREMQGLSYEEMSSSLDLPLGTLKAVLHRARNRLRVQLADAGVTP